MATRSDVERSIAISDRDLWIAGILLWGVADVAISTVGIISGAQESHPLYDPLMSLVVGLDLPFWILLVGTLAVWKLAALLLVALVYRAAPRPHRVGVPIGLSVWGAVVLIWNVAMIGSI